MFKRWSLHIALILLFALAQMGAITHEISHIDAHAKHSNQLNETQKDQNTQGEQCAQCISFAKIAGGLQTQPLVFGLAFVALLISVFRLSPYLSTHCTVYAARAPPYII